MFAVVNDRQRKRADEIARQTESSAIAEQESHISYLAMMADIELPEGETNEQDVQED